VTRAVERALRVTGPVQLVAATAVAAATFLPWVHSGRRAIDVHEAGALATRLELVGTPWLVRPAVALPLVLALAVLLRWWGRRGPAAVLALVAGAYAAALGVAAMVRLAPPARGGGPLVALVGATCLLTAATAELAWAPRAARAGGRVPQPRRPRSEFDGGRDASAGSRGVP
jgi:hypothetical protein